MVASHPPGPPPHRKRDFIRTARSIRRLVADPLDFIGNRFAEYGDIYHVDEGGGSHLYVTRHPDHIHDVLVTNARSEQICCAVLNLATYPATAVWSTPSLTVSWPIWADISGGMAC